MSTFAAAGVSQETLNYLSPKLALKAEHHCEERKLHLDSPTIKVVRDHKLEAASSLAKEEVTELATQCSFEDTSR